MLPLVTRVDEVRQAREMMAEEAASLREAGVRAALEVPVGVMIETPGVGGHRRPPGRGERLLQRRAPTISPSTPWPWTGATPGSPTASPRTIRRSCASCIRCVEVGRAADLPVSVCGEMASEAAERGAADRPGLRPAQRVAARAAAGEVGRPHRSRGGRPGGRGRAPSRRPIPTRSPRRSGAWSASSSTSVCSTRNRRCRDGGGLASLHRLSGRASLPRRLTAHHLLSALSVSMAGSKRHVFTSESVTEGHPDKVADQISDAVLDAILSRDPAGRVACETLVTTGMAVVAGEITTSTYVHIPDLVRRHGRGHRLHRRELRDGRPHLRGAHLDRPPVARHRDGRGFGPEQGAGRRRPGHDVRLRHQRDPGADAAADHAGAPDRGAAGRGAEGLPGHPRLEWLRPDGKSQVSVEYEGDRPVAVRTVVVSTQHAERSGSRQLGQGTIREGVIEEVIKPVLDAARSGVPRHQVPDQPDRPVRDRRSARRRRAHRPEDHRGHLRRHGPPRRRRLQRQGPVQGGPVGGVRRPLGRQEHRRGQAGPPVRGPGGLRDRRGAARSP